MKLTCEQMICFSKMLPEMDGNQEAKNFFISLTNGSLSVDKLPDFLSSITNIENGTFKECENLALTTIPESVKTIKSNAFTGCKKLALTIIPESVELIDDVAFSVCHSLISLTFKGTPTKIGSNAFQNCPNLTTINVPWSEGEVANAPWGATNATINYNYTGE